jgi:hypothetical protein
MSRPTAFRLLRSRRGVLLPTALFLVVALIAMATSLVALARNEAVTGVADFQYLRWQLESEEMAWSGGEGGEGGEGEEGEEGGWVTHREIGHGFLLVRSEPARGGPAPGAVYWRLDPDVVAGGFPPAAEVGRDPPSTGVSLLEGCPSGGESGPFVRVRTDPDDMAGESLPSTLDPPLSGPPRIGMLGVGDLLSLGVIEALGEEVSGPIPASPALARTGLMGLPEGGVLSAGSIDGVVVAGGDLLLEGSVVISGLVMVSGDLTLDGDAYLQGIALVGGRLDVRGQAEVQGCRTVAAGALDHPGLLRPHPVAGGSRLGRY